MEEQPTLDLSQLGLSLEFKPEDKDALKKASALIMANLVPVVVKMISEALKGNVPAAKFVYPFIADLFEEDKEQKDLWVTLKEDDVKREL
jgi:hypothetical protein